jgi:hypothetical protein
LNFGRWILGGTVGGLIGAAIWTAIGYFSGYEVGWIAWGIGFLVGFGVRVAAGDSMGKGPATTAAALAVAAVLLGKAGVIYFVLQDAMPAGEAQISFDDEMMIAGIADKVVEEREAAGEPVNWPEEVDPDEASSESDYPPEVWRQASQRWNDFGQAKQEEMRQQRIRENAALMESVRSALFKVYLKESFGPFDLLWLALAVITAFKLGSGVASEGD